MTCDSGSRPTGRDVKQARGEARQRGAERASPESFGHTPDAKVELVARAMYVAHAKYHGFPGERWDEEPAQSHWSWRNQARAAITALEQSDAVMGEEQDVGASADAETGSREPSPAVSALAGFDPARFEEVLSLLAGLVSGGDHSCLKGTPMIPLHRGTVADILGFLDELKAHKPPKAICGYPMPGWRLDRVQWDVRDWRPNGWIVSLKREPPDWHLDRREIVAMARSDRGPLEAWDEALRIALRSDEREAQRASAIEARRAETQGGSVADESAVGAAETPEPSSIAPVQDDDAEWLRTVVAPDYSKRGLYAHAEAIHNIASRLSRQAGG